jgi:hypothetical protein
MAVERITFNSLAEIPAPRGGGGVRRFLELSILSQRFAAEGAARRRGALSFQFSRRDSGAICFDKPVVVEAFNSLAEILKRLKEAFGGDSSTFNSLAEILSHDFGLSGVVGITFNSLAEILVTFDVPFLPKKEYLSILSQRFEEGQDGGAQVGGLLSILSQRFANKPTHENHQDWRAFNSLAEIPVVHVCITCRRWLPFNSLAEIHGARPS